MPHGPSDEVNLPQVQYQDMYACTTSMSASTGGQGRAGQGRAGQGRAGQGRAGQGTAGQGRARQGRAGYNASSHTHARQTV